VLILMTGERLRTLHDAAELITRRFDFATKSVPLEHAIGLLLRAMLARKLGRAANRWIVCRDRASSIRKPG
jgi:hypothetical protein